MCFFTGYTWGICYGGFFVINFNKTRKKCFHPKLTKNKNSFSYSYYDMKFKRLIFSQLNISRKWKINKTIYAERQMASDSTYIKTLKMNIVFRNVHFMTSYACKLFMFNYSIWELIWNRIMNCNAYFIPIFQLLFSLNKRLLCFM